MEGGRGGLRWPQRYGPGHPDVRGAEQRRFLRGGCPALRGAEPGGEGLPGAAAPGEDRAGGESAAALVPGQRHRGPEQLRRREAQQEAQRRLPAY